MFERITVRAGESIDPQSPLDIGLILEAMLFYKKTIVISGGGGSLKQLVRVFGLDNLNRLLDEEILEIVHFDTITAIHTRRVSGNREVHNAVTLGSPQHTFAIDIRSACIEAVGKEGKGRRWAQRLSQKIKVSNYDSSLAQSAKETLSNEKFLAAAVPRLLKDWLPGVKAVDEGYFKVEKSDQGLVVDTNLNFSLLNLFYAKKFPKSHSELSAARILSKLYEVENDLYHTSRNSSEISIPELDLGLIGIRLSHLAKACGMSITQKDDFQHFVFSGQRTIRESYNEGALDLKPVLDAIFASRKFKDWLGKQPIEASLLTEYCREVTKDSVLDKLPSKTARWSLFTGAGVIGELALPASGALIAGLSLSLLDTFLVDKIFGGWKPSQFVHAHLSDLLSKGGTSS